MHFINLSCPLQISEATELEDSTRQLATEFLVTLCEAREKAPGMMRKLPQHLARLFQCLVFFLLDIEVGAQLQSTAAAAPVPSCAQHCQ